jgi:hypothetical protein
MRLRYARLSTTGPVRPVNEDWLDWWESPDPLTREKQGSVALLADGVGGYENGEVASRLAVEAALKEFQSAPGDTKPYTLLRRMFASRLLPGARRTSSRVTRASDGDDPRRLDLPGRRRVRGERRRHPGLLHPPEDDPPADDDHVATSVPVKLGLMLERQAMASPKRSELTRSLGPEPFCQPDFATQLAAPRGLHPPVHRRPARLRARRGDARDRGPLAPL